MRFVWAFIVTLSLVVGTTRNHTWDRAHLAGISVAAHYHHPLRHRNGTLDQPPAYIAPQRAFTIVAFPATIVETVPVDVIVEVATPVSVLPRGPPVA